MTGQRLVLGPFNRVEGDLEVSLDLAAGVVQAAWVNSPLFRGFEQVLLGRAPLDALVVVPRICGICSVSQSAAAASALAQIQGVTPPPQGQTIANLILATENLADHLTHFYLFFMPDFAHAAYAQHPWHPAVVGRFAALRGEAAQAALPARSGLLRLLGLLAGHWPHSLALQPGGVTRSIGASERIRLLAQLRDFRRFLETTLIGDQLEAFAALASQDQLFAWAEGRPGDFPTLVNLARELGLHQLGQGATRFLSVGAYPSPHHDTNTSHLFPPGVWQAGTLSPLAVSAIREDSHHAWLADGQGPLPPARGETRVHPDKPGAYTWCKAPRYGDGIAEVGALARQLVAGHPLAQNMVSPRGATVLARVAARMLELAQVTPAMERWASALMPGEPCCLQAAMPPDASGVGLVEAARGSLGHWVELRKGHIARYQIIAPTTWNFSPRDHQGLPGPLEQALVGLPAGPDAPPTVQHVVRSYDPCMVCTVH